MFLSFEALMRVFSRLDGTRFEVGQLPRIPKLLLMLFLRCLNLKLTSGPEDWAPLPSGHSPFLLTI
jgi:hypothetical protein